MKQIIKILDFLNSKQKKQILGLQCLIVIVSLFELLGVASVAPFVGVATNPRLIQTNALLKWCYQLGGFASETKFLIAIGVLVFITIFLGNLLIFISNWLLTSFGISIGKTISVNLYEKYLMKNYLFHTQNNSANLGKNIFHEVLRVTNNVLVQFLILNSKLFSVAFISIGLIYLNPVLMTLCTLGFGLIYILVYFFSQRRLQNNSVEIGSLLGAAYKTVNEGFGGVKDIKLYRKESFFVRLFDDIMNSYSERAIFNGVVTILPRYVLEVLLFGGVVVFFIYLISSGYNINDYLPMLTVFIVAGLKLMPSLQQVFASITLIKSSIASLDIVLRDLSQMNADQEPFLNSNSSDSDFLGFKKLRMENVNFKYPGSKLNAVENLSFEIVQNSMYAFVGASGCGKSTVVDLISGLLQPNTGRIYINDKGLNSSNLRNWQSMIGYVSQTIYLMDSSIKENIAWGEDKLEIDMSRVIRAAQLANIHEFIIQKPDGYESRVGERGIQLSGGQRQRIGIARALYNNPPVLIFDEATSALDNNTERDILSAIEELRGQKTIILIAHRLLTVKNCHQIYLMNSGRIESNGTYQELLQKNILFKSLAERPDAN